VAKSSHRIGILKLGFFLVCLQALSGCHRAVPASWREPVTGMELVYIPPGRSDKGFSLGFRLVREAG